MSGWCGPIGPRHKQSFKVWSRLSADGSLFRRLKPARTKRGDRSNAALKAPHYPCEPAHINYGNIPTIGTKALRDFTHGASSGFWVPSGKMSFRYTRFLLCATLTAFVASASQAQTTSPALKDNIPATKPSATSSAQTPEAQSKEAGHRKFVLDVVQSAVALPQPDPQDRLRVLSAAASLVSPIDNDMAKRFAKEGARIETELVSSGEKPAVSMIAAGQVDCAGALAFVQTIPPASVLDAEQSLVGAVTNCPETREPAARKVEAGMEQGVVAARAVLALMDENGMQSQWSQQMFVKLFGSLPADAVEYVNEAPNYAAMFVRAAPEMDKDAVKTAGLKFLLWMGKLPDSNQRKVAVNMTTDAMNAILGKEVYDELLRSDVMAQQVAASGDKDAVLAPPQEENVSVLQAMQKTDDQTSELEALPPSMRAREAAASGFASGTAGNRKMADHYFDIAFSSLDEVWSSRAKIKTSAPEVVQEVSEAAAQVNATDALQRTQRLQDPSAEAIGMLAVARVVEGSE